MAGRLPCDNCGAEGAYIIGNMDTGEQAVACGACRGSGGGAAVATAAPDLCTMCELLPPIVRLTALESGEDNSVCMRCWLQTCMHVVRTADADERRGTADVLDALGIVDPDASAGKRKRANVVALRAASGSREAVDAERTDEADIDAAIHNEHTAGAETAEG